MGTLLAPTEVGDRRKLRWTAEALEEAIRTGLVSEDSRYEILDGDLYEKMGQGWPHAFAIRALTAAFTALDSEAFDLSVQMPVRVGEHLPEPDFAVVRGSFRTRHRHPDAEELLLLVEVADSSIALDQRLKASIYASGEVPVYWIVDLNKRRVEVHSRPEEGTYAESRIFGLGEEIPSAFSGAPKVSVNSLIAPED